MQGMLYNDLNYFSIPFTDGKHYNKSSNKYIHIFLHQFHTMYQKFYKFVCALPSNSTFRIYLNELFKNGYKDLIWQRCSFQDYNRKKKNNGHRQYPTGTS